MQIIQEFVDNNKEKITRDFTIIGSAPIIAAGLLDRAIPDIDLLYYEDEPWFVTYVTSGKIDFVKWNLTIMAPDYMDRATLFYEYQGVKFWGISLEDCIINKVGAYCIPKHKADVALLWPLVDKKLFFKLLEKAEARTDYYEIREAKNKRNIGEFKLDYLEDYIEHRKEI